MKVPYLADETDGGERFSRRMFARAPGGAKAFGELEAYVCTMCGWFVTVRPWTA